jgi:hypothetical protein
MALTAQQQLDLYKLGVGAYQASPGIVYMNWFAGLIESGMTIADLWEFAAADPTFMQQDFGFTNAATNEQFATAFVDNVTGDTLSAENRDFAIDFITAALDGGLTRGQAMHLAIDALDAVPHDDPNFGAAAARFDNQVEVARDYTENLSGAALALATLQDTISSVDETPESVAAAKASNAIDVGQGQTTTFTLSLDEDNVVGTSGDDVINAPVVQGENPGDEGQLTTATLQSIDIIDGGAGNDTLNATLNGESVAPTISNVEIINIRDTHDPDSTISLASVTGLQQIWNRNSISDATLTIEEVGSTDILFGVANTGAHTEIGFAEDVLDGESDELKLELNGAGGGEISVFGGEGDIESVALNVIGDNEADIFGVGGAITDITITGTGGVDLLVNAASLETLDASTMVQGLDIDIRDASSVELNVQTGAGDDRVVIDGTLLNADNEDIMVDMGEGANTIALANIISDVEIGNLVFSAATLEGISGVEFTDDITLAADATIDFDPLEPGALLFDGISGGGVSTLGLDNTAAELEVTTGDDVFDVDIDFATAEVLTINTEDDFFADLFGESLTSLTVNATESDTSFEFGFFGQDDPDADTLTSITLNDTSDDGDVFFFMFLEAATNVNTIAVSGGESTGFELDVSANEFDGSVTIEIGDFGVDAEGEVNGGLEYLTNSDNDVRETFEFVGTNIADVYIEGFTPGIGGTADRLDFSGFPGVESLDDLSIVFDGTDTVITNSFDGTITVAGVDLTTDDVNFII